MPAESPFRVRSDVDEGIGSTLVVGLSHLGMAGVTTADYLVRHLESTQIGNVDTADLPAITPFEEGVPRRHSRLYAVDEADIVVLVSELFVPVSAARSYVDALLEWTDAQDVSEIAVLHGVPYQHGPEEHDVFHVATEGYRAAHLDDGRFQPLKGGFLDGVVGELLSRSLDEAAPDTGVFVTPTHPPGPDVEAATQLLEALEEVYGFDVDETELRALGEQLTKHYEQLAGRLAEAQDEDALGSRDYPVDRMYM